MMRKSVLFIFSFSLLFARGNAQEQWPLPMFGFSPDPQAQQSAAAAREDERYDDGQEYLDEQNWNGALEAFNEVIGMKGRRTDAALYWKAYALNKMGRRSDAQTVITELRRAYPRSNWLKDAGALELEIKSARGPVNPDLQADEELKLFAIQSLMNSDEARAIPMLKKILDSPNHSPRVKNQALFVLAQSNSQEAQQLILSVARGQTHPPSQKKAIQYLAIHGGGQSRQALEQIYRASTDASVKRAVLQSFITCGCEQSTLAVLREERDPELRRRAIHNLGAMGATEQLRQLLFQSSTGPEDKEKIMEALGVAGDVTTLAEIARTPGDARVRRKAIHGLGISGGKQATATLAAIYSDDKDVEIRKAAVDGLFIRGADHELVQLARKETDPKMRRYLIEKLSLMDSKEARDLMIEILNK